MSQPKKIARLNLWSSRS